MAAWGFLSSYASPSVYASCLPVCPSFPPDPDCSVLDQDSSSAVVFSPIRWELPHHLLLSTFFFFFLSRGNCECLVRRRSFLIGARGVFLSHFLFATLRRFLRSTCAVLFAAGQPNCLLIFSRVFPLSKKK
eukprot:RCo042946